MVLDITEPEVFLHHNIHDLLETGYHVLQEVGILDATYDAKCLLSELTGIRLLDFFLHYNDVFSDDICLQYQTMLLKRMKHIPLQLILGKQEFMGLSFYVNEDVLIPRSDTEVLVEECMKHVREKDCILDMCTGSGCILLSILYYTKHLHTSGVGVDISPKALEVANRNAMMFDTDANFFCGDLFEPLKKDVKFHLIVANPPYIKTSEIASLMPEVFEYEPHLALDGKEDGLFFYKKIIAQIELYLCRGGYLLFEIGYDQGEIVKKMMIEKGFCDVMIQKDLNGLDRVVLGYL